MDDGHRKPQLPARLSDVETVAAVLIRDLRHLSALDGFQNGLAQNLPILETEGRHGCRRVVGDPALGLLDDLFDRRPPACLRHPELRCLALLPRLSLRRRLPANLPFLEIER
jgi:hypothetical protein